MLKHSEQQVKVKPNYATKQHTFPVECGLSVVYPS